MVFKTLIAIWKALTWDLFSLFDSESNWHIKPPRTSSTQRLYIVCASLRFLDALLAEASASSQPVNFHVLIWMPRASLSLSAIVSRMFFSGKFPRSDRPGCNCQIFNPLLACRRSFSKANLCVSKNSLTVSVKPVWPSCSERESARWRVASEHTGLASRASYRSSFRTRSAIGVNLATSRCSLIQTWAASQSTLASYLDADSISLGECGCSACCRCFYS